MLFRSAFGGLSDNTVYYIVDVIDLLTFKVSATPSGPPVTLTNAHGIMYAEAANQRMAVYTINIDPLDQLVTLTLNTQTHPNDYVQVTGGTYYNSALLYYATSLPPGKTRVDWEPLPQVPTSQTTFDENSMQFTDPVDMYYTEQTFDKYLVFPKSNILI